ncbi:MAG: DUF2141 domain-containing protein [Micropepsaceae bacterium]
MLKQTLAAAALLAFTGLAQAENATVEVAVDGLKAGIGTLYAGLCTQAEFMQGPCALKAKAKVEADTATLTFENVTPGRYAVAAWWDVNDNAEMERGGYGEPLEPTGASNGAVGMMGPPVFSDAAFDVPASGPVAVTVK